jgi:hypothetical protein
LLAVTCVRFRSFGVNTPQLPVDGEAREGAPVDVRGQAPGRWAALFADVEGELDAAEAAELDAEVSDRTAYEVGRLTLADRLTAALGTDVAVTTNGAGTVRGQLTDAAPDWLVVGDTLVPTAAVTTMTGLGVRAARPGAIQRRLTLGYALRALAGQDATVTTTDGTMYRGTIDRVGADFVDVSTEQGGKTIRHVAIAAVRPG